MSPLPTGSSSSCISWLRRQACPIELVGTGSKRAVGRPVEAAVTITTASLRGITLYEPNELVMSARAGTPLSQIEAELAARGQMLAFEPIDLGPAIGAAAGTQTIGAVFATNLSGARRIPRARRAITCSASRASTAAPRSSSPAAAS